MKWYNVLLIHRSSRSPICLQIAPHGEGWRVPADFFDIQRISFVALILFRQIGIFLLKSICTRNGVFANFFQ